MKFYLFLSSAVGFLTKSFLVRGHHSSSASPVASSLSSTHTSCPSGRKSGWDTCPPLWPQLSATPPTWVFCFFLFLLLFLIALSFLLSPFPSLTLPLVSVSLLRPFSPPAPSLAGVKHRFEPRRCELEYQLCSLLAGLGDLGPMTKPLHPWAPTAHKWEQVSEFLPAGLRKKTEWKTSGAIACSVNRNVIVQK